MFLDWLHEFGRGPSGLGKTGKTERLQNEMGPVLGLAPSLEGSFHPLCF